jgi:ribosomal-protein-alanine N-acetyltransferase
MTVPLPSPLPPWLRLRTLTLADLDGVLAIENRALPVPWSREGYTNELTRNKLAHYVALDLWPNGAATPPTLAGFCGYWVLVDELHVSMVAVDPALQGHGLGELLLLAALWQGSDPAGEQPVTLATLEVREHNHTAQALYRKLRFETVGVRKRYYRDSGEDALIMTVASADSTWRTCLAAAWEARIGRLTTTPPPFLTEEPVPCTS